MCVVHYVLVHYVLVQEKRKWKLKYKKECDKTKFEIWFWRDLKPQFLRESEPKKKLKLIFLDQNQPKINLIPLITRRVIQFDNVWP